MDSQIQLQKYDEALSSLQERINRFPNDPMNHLLKGNLFELKKEQDKADESFQKAVDIAAREPSTIARLAQEFQEKNKFEWALKAYQADRKSTRLNSSHVAISYAVLCLIKKKLNT